MVDHRFDASIAGSTRRKTAIVSSTADPQHEVPASSDGGACTKPGTSIARLLDRQVS
jgi:hypothetical protein